MTFIVKTPEQLQALSGEELGKYMADHQAYEKSVNDERHRLMEEKSAELLNKYNALHDSLESAKKDRERAVEQVKALSATVKAQKESSIITSSGDWLQKGLEANIAKLQTLKSGNALMNDGQSAGFVVKAVADMTKPTNISDQTLFPEADLISGLNRIQLRAPWVSQYIRTATTTSDKVRWVYQATPEGGATRTAEAALKPLYDFNQTVETRDVEKYAVRARLSMEMLDDISYMNAELRSVLIENLQLKVDADQLSGTGTNELFGLRTDATAYAAGSFAATIDEANIIDVLETAMTQVYVNNFIVTTIFMNPIDVTKITTKKASDGHYLPKLQVAGGELSLNGVPIIKNNGMPAGEFLVMDGRKATLFERDPLSIRTGLGTGDFENNMLTYIAEWRGVQVVKNNDRGAMVAGDFATAIAALETP